jgi:hypothetical protein
LKMLTLVVFTLSISLATSTSSQSFPPPMRVTSHQRLAVRISPSKPTYLTTEPLDLRVEFRNEGDTRIRVGRAIEIGSSAPFRLSVKIEDSQGNLTLDPLRDPVELPCLDLRESNIRQPIIWTEIGPNSTYSTGLAVTSRALKSAHPGIYKIEGHYRSFGLLSGGHCINFNENAQSSKSSYDSTGTEWRGEVDTNTVWITVLPPGGADNKF